MIKMRWTESFKSRFRGLGNSITRFPLTTLFLLAMTILNALMIENRQMDFTRLIYSFLVGALLSAVAQMHYERFFEKSTFRVGLMIGSLTLTLGYYFIIGPQNDVNLDVTIKTFAAFFALLMAFIWIPSINNENIFFHQSFLAAFKSFFITLLFALVLALGMGAIYSAIDYLLFNVDPYLFTHTLNIVGSFFAPLYFLSLTPFFSEVKENKSSALLRQEEVIKNKQQFRLPHFFELLLSYVVIPLIVIYTLILLIYILMNITGDFWTDNLLEPLLVSYAVSVLIVLTLSYNSENRFAVLFRKIFPKILVPIALFQTVASILRIREMGITHGRYYVILFGIFATLAGLIMSLMKPKFHGYIVAVLLLFITFSIVPPLDAFSISKRNQLSLFENKLRENNILVEGEIQPNDSVSVSDRIIITKTAVYINNLGYISELSFLPENFDLYTDFQETFGFNLTYSQIEETSTVSNYIYLNRDELVVETDDSDVLLFQMLTSIKNIEQEPFENLVFTINNENYFLERTLTDAYYILTLKNDLEEEIISYPLEEIFEEVFDNETALPFYEERFLTVEEATFINENERVELRLIVLSLEQNEDYNSAELLVLINFK